MMSFTMRDTIMSIGALNSNNVWNSTLAFAEFGSVPD